MGNITLYLFILMIIYFVAQISYITKRSKKNKLYLAYIDQLNDKEKFLSKGKDYQHIIDNDEFLHKGYIIEAYGNTKFQLFHKTSKILDKLDLQEIFNRNPRKQIPLNEDSFYYLMILTPIAAIHYNKLNIIEEINNIVIKNNDILKDYLFYNIYQEIYKYAYDKNYQCDYFIKMLEGDYNGLYSKQFIGVLKNCAFSILSTTDYYKEHLKDDIDFNQNLANFSDSKAGETLLKYLGQYDMFNNILKQHQKEID